MYGMNQCRCSNEVSRLWRPATRAVAKSCSRISFCLTGAVARCNRWMDCICLYEWIQHLDLMPSSASWKKDSSGSIYFFEENG